MKNALATLFLSIVLFFGLVSVVLYNIGDRFLNEFIEIQMNQALTSLDSEATLASVNNNVSTSVKEDQKEPNGNIDKTIEVVGKSVVASENKTSSSNKSKAGNTQSGTTSSNSEIVKASNEQEDKVTLQQLEKTGDNVILQQLEQAEDNVTLQQLIKAKNRLSAKDKIIGATLVIRRLTGEDIKELNGMLADGLTAQEKDQAKKILYKRFNEKEIEQIKEIYGKYIV